MKISDVIMQPKYLRSEIEALQLLFEEVKTLLPESPILSRITATIAEYEKRITEEETWLENVPDSFIRNTIKAYQLTGDWSKTNIRLYGYPSYHTCRKAVIRYLEKTDFMERFG